MSPGQAENMTLLFSSSYQGIRCCREHVTCKDFLSSFVEEVMLTEIFNKKCAGLAALYYSGDNRKAC
jgi:hypothetical protein